MEDDLQLNLVSAPSQRTIQPTKVDQPLAKPK